jgi:hypothetical protein
MNEFVYKLNLPPLSEILIDSAKNSLFNETNDLSFGRNVSILRYLTNEWVKPEWLTFNNYNWNHILYFYKKNSSGFVHLDGKNIKHQPHHPCVWGINWIYGNDGIMEYWLMKDILPMRNQPNDNNDRIICIPIKKPYRVYHMTEGAYLVNASFPHKATCQSERYAFSLRDNTCVENWDTVITNFKNYII